WGACGGRRRNVSGQYEEVGSHEGDRRTSSAEIGRTAGEQTPLQDRLRASERRFRALVEHSADGILLLDAQGTITCVSRRASQVLGYAPEERLGSDVFAPMHDDDRPTIKELFAQLR